MIFNSVDFAFFLPTVFFLYWFVAKKSIKSQNLLLVVSSYFFYGWWDWRFLSLIIFSSLIDYSIGISLSQTQDSSKRKLLLITSLSINLGFLLFFKYFNFFIDNFVDAFSFFGKSFTPISLNVILPVGISFYTFQTLSYSIDVYKKKLQPTKDLISFMAFVSFFPQLVAGPIERATNLLPQFSKKRTFNYIKAVDGLRQILWGLFKKVVIADNCAIFVNDIFENHLHYSGSTLLLGAVFFAFQIYCDFSGYSDIAIGVARIFGFNLMKNFAFPYFSRDMAEFWRRWHISLSTWFRDYLYIPLGGSRGDIRMKIRNVFIIFLVSGFWHGANWTFIVWGALNALYFLPSMLLNKNRQNIHIVAKGKTLPTFKEFFNINITFFLAVIAWIFFRAENINHAITIISNICSTSLFSIPNFPNRYDAFIIILLIAFMTLIEWAGRENEYAIEKITLMWNKGLRISFYYMIVFFIFIFSNNNQGFIYFQF